MEFSRQGYWSGLPFPPPRDLPDLANEPMSSALQADSLPLSHLGSPQRDHKHQTMLSQSYKRGAHDPYFPEIPWPLACSEPSPPPQGKLVEASTVSFLTLWHSRLERRWGGGDAINISRIKKWFSTMWGELRFSTCWSFPPILKISPGFIKMRIKRKTD